MPIQQRRKTFTPPAQPIKRPSPKVESYKGLSKTFNTLSDLHENMFAEDKDSRRRGPPGLNVVQQALHNSFDSLDDSERLGRGAQAQHRNKFTYEDFVADQGEVLSQEEFDKALEHEIKYGKLIPRKELLKTALTRMAHEGAPFNTSSGKFGTLKERLDKISPTLYSTIPKEMLERTRLSRNYNGIRMQTIEEQSRAEQSGGLIRNFNQKLKNIDRSMNDGNISPKQAQHLKQLLYNFQSRAINNKNVMDQRIDTMSRNNTINRVFGPFDTSGSPKTQLENSVMAYKERVNSAATKMKTGEMLMTDGPSLYTNVQGVPSALVDQARPKIDGMINYIKEAILPQQGSVVASSVMDPLKTLGKIIPSTSHPFGTAYMAHAYQNLMRNRSDSANFQAMNKTQIYKESMGMLGLREDHLEKSAIAFNERSAVLQRAGVTAKEYANAVTLEDQAHRDRVLSKVIRFSRANPAFDNTAVKDVLDSLQGTKYIKDENTLTGQRKNFWEKARDQFEPSKVMQDLPQPQGAP